MTNDSGREENEAKQSYQDEQIALEAGANETESDMYTEFAAQHDEVKDETDLWQAGAGPDKSDDRMTDQTSSVADYVADHAIEVDPVTSDEEYAAEIAEPVADLDDDSRTIEAVPADTALDEEYAAEIAAPDTGLSRLRDMDIERSDAADGERDREDAGTTLGWTAFILAIASLFLWPVLLGPTSAILGFFAYSRGRRALGSWAIAIGLIAFISAFLFRLYR